jgi:spore coat protein A
MISRRQFFKLTAAAGVGLAVASKSGGSGLRPVGGLRASAVSLIPGVLSDPALQPKFVNTVPDAMAPTFKYVPAAGQYTVGVGPTTQWTGLMNGGQPVNTPLFGYGDGGPYTWPGKTFEVQSGVPTTVNWYNNLGNAHLLPVDTSLHWCYSLPGYENYTIASTGVPIITHVHGSHVDSIFDGNPEYFFNPGATVVGPQWANVGGFTNQFVYDNSQPAGTIWYHDHALGITRLNVYAGMAGFYIIRDALDTGLANNPLGLPAWPYEKAYAIQDRMFKTNGELFYPAFPGDPFWADFITGMGLADDAVPQPSALAEFFGDHMLVNGMIWPKEDVEPRNYRLRLLNGCDSRFLGVQFRAVLNGASTGTGDPGAIDFTNAGAPIPFWVIGSDQGLAFKATDVATLLIGPGERYDVVFDFSQVPAGSRVIMENIGGDAPFGGALVGPGFPAADLFPDRQTDRIMAFDVVKPLDNSVPDAFDHKAIQVYQKNKDKADRIRKVALFEGLDEYGRLQPLLGVAEPTVDAAGNTVNGALAWHSPTTENPALNSTEIWEIYNATADAHPVHLHLVHFEVLDRQAFNAKLIPQPVIQHNGQVGQGFRLERIRLSGKPVESDGVERAPKDMVTALPGQVTRIKARFDKPGRYVWHCHILSHEDHEMMRVLQVG